VIAYAVQEALRDFFGVPRSERSSCVGGEEMARIFLDADDLDSTETTINLGGTAADDRRSSSRAGVTVRIDYATVDEMFSEFTRDINEGGLFIETEKPHQAGTEVSMQFHLPGSQEVLHTIGRVVRVSSGGVGAPAGMGIEFDELTADDRVKIDQIVRALRADGAI